jgi:phage shock protein PspC (stress-responsive transcriptional regulator)
MPIALTVVLLVLGVTAVVGIAAYIVDRSTARQERKQ